MSEEFYHKDIFGEVVNIRLDDLGEDKFILNSSLEKVGVGFNPFSITDAFGARDKKRAWVLYQQALLSGLSPEEIFWKLVWQIKSLLVAAKTGSVAETDMKPFPYNKAKSLLKYWQLDELQKFSEDMVRSYYETRRGKDTEIVLEKIILSL